MPHHRQVEAPTALKSWVWSQHWRDLLFLHWRVDLPLLRALVPAPLEVAECDGSVWVSLVLFRLRVRPRGLPFMPVFSNLVEVNLRTYVHCQGKPGIWFLSVHADNRLAIRLARLLTPIPYVHAPMRYPRIGRAFHFEASDGLLGGLTFVPRGPITEPEEDTLDAWLLERYRLFVTRGHSSLEQAEVAHARWRTQDVEVSIGRNNFGAALGLHLARVPDRAHFSEGVSARFGAFQTVVETSPVPASGPLRFSFLRIAGRRA